MEKFLVKIDRVNSIVGEIVAWLVYLGMIVICFEVIMRYVFNAPTLWGSGVAQRIFVIYFILCGGYVLLNRQHINMDVVYNKLSVRARAVLDVITSVFTIVVAVSITWYGAILARQSIITLERDNSAWSGPVWPFHLIVPVAGLLLLLQAIAKSVRDFSVAVRKENA